jgi:hypothetical protein
LVRRLVFPGLGLSTEVPDIEQRIDPRSPSGNATTRNVIAGVFDLQRKCTLSLVDARAVNACLVKRYVAAQKGT